MVRKKGRPIRGKSAGKSVASVVSAYREHLAEVVKPEVEYVNNATNLRINQTRRFSTLALEHENDLLIAHREYYSYAVKTRNRLLELRDRNSVLSYILKRYKTVIAGQHGFTFSPAPLKLNGEIDRELALQIKRLWEKDTRAPLITSKQTFDEVISELIEDYVLRGELFLEYIPYAGNSEQALNLRIWKSHQLDMPDYQLAGVPKSDLDAFTQSYEVVSPIKRDSYDRPVEYQFNKFGNRSYKVAARNLFALLNCSSEYERGVSPLAAVLSKCEDADRLVDILVAHDEAQAQTAVAVKHVPTYSEFDAFQQKATPPKPRIERDGVIRTVVASEGWEVSHLDLPRGQSGALNTLESLLRQIAGAVGVQADLMLGKITNSYSATRAAILTENANLSLIRNALLEAVLYPLYSAWFDTCVRTGRLSFNPSDYEAVSNVVIKESKMPSLDLNKEVQGWRALTEMGAYTLADVQEEMGRDANDQYGKLLQEYNLYKADGVPHPLDGPKYSQPQQSDDSDDAGGEEQGDEKSESGQADADEGQEKPTPASQRKAKGNDA